jgi:haloalkane dehalogenase
LPIAGEPADVTAVVEDYAQWLSTSSIPKLFIDADPGGFLVGGPREFCRTWPNQETVSVKGYHFLQEEAPDPFGDALARFVAKIRVGAKG